LLLIYQRRRFQETQNALRKSESQLALACEAAGLGLWSWDVPADRIWLSPGFCTLLGMPADTRLGYEAFFALIHPEDRAAMRRAFAAVSSQNTKFNIEARFVGPGGLTRTLISRGIGSFTRPNAAYFERLIGASLDVSELRQVENEHRRQRDELAHLARVATLGELTGALAHEISQPLGGILLNAQTARLLLDQPPLDLDQLRTILDDIVQDDKRATEVIRRTRSLLKKSPPEVRSVVLGELVQETLEFLNPYLTRRSVTASASLGSNKISLLVDPVQIQQVLINLILNSAEALQNRPPSERLISIRARLQPDHQVALRIEDRGPGIPPERLALLFKPFQSTKPNGLGIGLSLCRSLIEAHGGNLTLENHKRGTGAVATITLPAGVST
jgi:C4-dicarboxylate-specific signal transduction histidine kinase